ncbi:hypothetical protein C4D60_Mb05t03460 [Musa balbisiana]|uniref:Uncharacterized protein n=1 Tax=Musa balbisiana TaxID=52838 RepID=A0A4S8JTH7_MUSBA|nr:hypothetical protein C4D60_Mb05t03460 [Musa balbisiana]
MAASMALGDIAVDSPPSPCHARRGRPAPALLKWQKRSRRTCGLVVAEMGGQYEEEGFDDVRVVKGAPALVGKSRPFRGLMVDFIICPHGMSARGHGPMRNVHSGQSQMVKSDNLLTLLQLINYFTYKAARTVLHQLHEMNPPSYMWLYKTINHLMEKQDLAERVMITCFHLYGKWIKKCDHAKTYQQISE